MLTKMTDLSTLCFSLGETISYKWDKLVSQYVTINQYI